MRQNFVLQATKREITGKGVKNLRIQKLIPAILYGHGVENILLSIPYGPFHKLFKEAGYSNIITLELDSQKYDVLIHEVSCNCVSDEYSHIDLFRIRQDEKITTEIPLKIIGESLVIKEKGGVLLTEADTIEVRCFPKDLVHEIEVDISAIKNFNEPIHVKDITVPKELEVLTEKETVVVNIIPPRKEEESSAGEVSTVPEELKKEQEAQAAAAKQAKEVKKKE